MAAYLCCGFRKLSLKAETTCSYSIHVASAPFAKALQHFSFVMLLPLLWSAFAKFIFPEDKSSWSELPDEWWRWVLRWTWALNWPSLSFSPSYPLDNSVLSSPDSNCLAASPRDTLPVPTHSTMTVERIVELQLHNKPQPWKEDGGMLDVSKLTFTGKPLDWFRRLPGWTCFLNKFPGLHTRELFSIVGFLSPCILFAVF